MSSARIQALVTRVCLGPPEVLERLARDPRVFARAEGLGEEDADAIAAVVPRLGLYRRLVRTNLTAVVAAVLEGTRARFEAHRPGRFDATVDAFLAEVGPRTPHLRDVPAELLAFAAPRWREGADVPAFLVEHAQLELAGFVVATAARAPIADEELGAVAPDRPLAFAEPTALVDLAHAVHELPEGEPSALPEARRCAILLYRDASHRARRVELTPLAAAIVARLFAGGPLGVAVDEAAAGEGITLDDAARTEVARLLADLATRGVLLGARLR